MMTESEDSQRVEQLWRTYLTTGEFVRERRQRQFFRLLPGYPRCKNCYAPFAGPGSWVVKAFYGKRPSSMNPRLCNVCEDFVKRYQGGAEIELTLLFVDMRDSTALAEKMSPSEFRALVNRYYVTASRIMVMSDALIDKIVGDQVAGMYVPGFAGPHHALVGIRAAQEIMEQTGHNSPEGAWVGLGVGVHTGTAYVGSVGSAEGTTDITVLGDPANVAARLASSAGHGEILVSEDALRASGRSLAGLEPRELKLKGKTEKVRAFVLTDDHF